MTLALIAGQGGLPPRLVSALRAQGDLPVLCELEQFPSSVRDEDLNKQIFRLETLGSLLRNLQEQGVTRICMAGAIRRPDIDPTLIDPATMPLVPQVMAAMAQGDDGTLRAVIGIFESHGFDVVGASQLDSTLLPPVGVLTDAKPAGDIERDIGVGLQALAEMGAADLGQAVVIRDASVLAREEDAGTDAMLAALNPNSSNTQLPDDPGDMGVDQLAQWLAEQEAAPDNMPASGSILYKAPKPGQELRVDMPVIGLTTVIRAAEAGLSGIVIEAGSVMVLDLGHVLQILNARNMFLWVREP